MHVLAMSSESSRRARRSINAAFAGDGQPGPRPCRRLPCHPRAPAEARVGIAHQLPRSLSRPKPGSPLDQRVQRACYSGCSTISFPRRCTDGVLHYPDLRAMRIPEAKGTQDFLGVNYYTRDHVAFDLLKAFELFGRHYSPARTPSSADTGFIANVPEGMFEALKWGMQFERADDRHRERCGRHR